MHQFLQAGRLGTPSSLDYLNGSPGKYKTNPTDATTVPDTVSNKYYTIVTNYIMENKNIQKYLTNMLGQDVPFQDMDEGERRKILLKLKKEDFSKVLKT